MDKEEALKVIKNALDLSIQKGIFKLDAIKILIEALDILEE